MKKCGICKQIKAEEEFYRHRFTSDGLRGSCKICINSARIQSYRKNRTLSDIRSRNWKRNRIYLTPYALLNQQLRSLKYNCKKRGIRKKIKDLPITISINDLRALWDIQKGLCAITGLPMEFQRRSLRTVSIDRRDSSQGYTPLNIQLVTKFANLGKGVYPNEDALKIIAEIRKCPI